MSDDTKKPAEAKAGSSTEASAKVEEKKPVEEKAEAKKSEVKLDAKLQKIVDEVEKLTILEVAELVKGLEDKFGVSAAAPMAMMAAGPAAAAAPAEEKTEFDVVLTSSGANKIAVIKAVRTINQDLGLVEAKELVDKLPTTLLEKAKKEDADKAKAVLEEAGAQVELK